jgi:hypothetical protein
MSQEGIKVIHPDPAEAPTVFDQGAILSHMYAGRMKVCVAATLPRSGIPMDGSGESSNYCEH